MSIYFSIECSDGTGTLKQVDAKPKSHGSALYMMQTMLNCQKVTLHPGELSHIPDTEHKKIFYIAKTIFKQYESRMGCLGHFWDWIKQTIFCRKTEHAELKSLYIEFLEKRVKAIEEQCKQLKDPKTPIKTQPTVAIKPTQVTTTTAKTVESTDPSKKQRLETMNKMFRIYNKGYSPVKK